MKKLSVIVPIYNAEKTLTKCMDSILNQEYSNTEIILVDDGSCDNSLALCRKYANQDNRVVVYHKENAGLVAARKSGAELATGEYIGFVDSDDYLDADMYSYLMKEANEKNSDIVIGGIQYDYPNQTNTSTLNSLPTGYYDRTAIEKTVIPNMLIKKGFYRYGIIPGVVVKVFKRELIRKSLEYVDNALTLGEDVAITSYAILDAESVSVVENAGYHYVQTETSMIRGYNPGHFDALCKMYRCIDHISEPAYRKQTGGYFAYVLYGILADCVRHNKISETKMSLKRMLDDPITVKALSEADVSDWCFFDKLKVFLMKHKTERLLTAILAR